MKPMLWTVLRQKSVDLQMALMEKTDIGTQLDGFALQRATAISGDGTTIFGTGIDPRGGSIAWRVIVKGGLVQL